MKNQFLATTFILISLTSFGQQPQKPMTLTNKEKIQQAAAKEYVVRVQNENNQMASDALKSLNDTTISTEERKIHIDNYRKSVRNGNPANKKKSYDLTTEETLSEYKQLSKSPKFNKSAQALCIEMHDEIVAKIERQKRIDADPLADENCYEYNELQDTTRNMNYGTRKQMIEGYIKFKLNTNDPDREKKKEMLKEMSTSPKFDKKTQDLSLELYNNYN